MFKTKHIIAAPEIFHKICKKSIHKYLTNFATNKLLQSCSKIVETNAKKGVVVVATTNVKLFLKVLNLYMIKVQKFKLIKILDDRRQTDR